jgi:diguanylate cyclase (GGDEF)-like protein/PAS domain S-box-containing protein
LLWYPFAFHENGFYLLTLNQIHSNDEWAKESIDFLDSVSKLVSVALEKIRMMAEEKQAEKDMRIAATAFETQEGILITDAQSVILRVNQAFTKITGYSAEEIIGKNPIVLSSGRQNADFYSEMWQSINATGSWSGEIWNRRKNGEIYPEYLTVATVKDKDGNVTNYVASLADITKYKRAEEEIRRLAFFDPLTHLPNRRLLFDRLQQATTSAIRSGKEGALLFINLDNFKTLNDTHGHAMGDLLLHQVAKRLATCVREGDTVARIGGDEFVVMLEELSSTSVEAAAKAESIGMKIINTLNFPYNLETISYRSTPSIGVTLFNGKNDSIDELFKKADIAMYQAKKAGRNTVCFFDPEMQATIAARVNFEAEMRKAIADREQFLLYYQGQVDSAGRVIGVEVLARWDHPVRGIVSPVEFIPLAEESGLILPLGHWILETACRQMAAWSAQPETAHLTVSVNVSAKQFLMPTFVDEVLTLIEYFGINPAKLKLEITESMLLNNVDDIIEKMSALKGRGVQFSMDDFGTGYSSLQYLKKLPLDQIKIDQSFVRDLAVDENDKAIVRTIIAMAKSMGLSTLAEGVETEEQRQFLLSEDCANYQGFLFSRPLPLEQFEQLMRQG